LSEYELRVKLFGEMELENEYGCVVEKRERQPLPLLMLKYLLVNPSRNVSLEELVTRLWPSKPGIDDEGATRVRLRRVRQFLEPLHLDGPDGLVLYSFGQFWLNPKYTLLTDEEAFLGLLQQIQDCPLEDPAGLKLCIEALGLYRGRFLEFTKKSDWLIEYRKFYHSKFCSLAYNTLDRMAALQDNLALPLLCRRTVALAPEEKELHEAIIRYLGEQKRELDLVRYISQLSGTGASETERLSAREVESLYDYCIARDEYELLEQWNTEKNEGLTPRAVTKGSQSVVWWKCSKGHEWKARVNARVQGTGCPICRNRKVKVGENDLATVHPEIAAQWHPELNGDLTPQMVTAGSHKKVWWQCSAGHAWESVIAFRTGKRKTGCPICAGKVKESR